MLTVTDAANVPIVCQSECFCTNKTRDPFTQEELSSLFKKHPSLMGFVQVELSTNGVTNEKLAYDEVTEDKGVNKNILARLKSCIKACAENVAAVEAAVAKVEALYADTIVDQAAWNAADAELEQALVAAGVIADEAPTAVENIFTVILKYLNKTVNILFKHF